MDTQAVFRAMLIKLLTKGQIEDLHRRESSLGAFYTITEMDAQKAGERMIPNEVFGRPITQWEAVRIFNPPDLAKHYGLPGNPDQRMAHYQRCWDDLIKGRFLRVINEEGDETPFSFSDLKALHSFDWAIHGAKIIDLTFEPRNSLLMEIGDE